MRPDPKEMTNEEPSVPKLIKCGDHSYAPWGIVCVHLLEGTANDWLAIPQEPGSECENDWLCQACADKLPDMPNDDLRAICIHCIREARKAAGLRP